MMMRSTLASGTLVAVLVLTGCPDEPEEGGGAAAAAVPPSAGAPATEPDPTGEPPAPADPPEGTPAPELQGTEEGAPTEEAAEGEASEEGEEPGGDEEPEPSAGAEPEMLEAGGIRITELALAGSVEGGQPVDPRTTYSKAADQRIYCFVRLENTNSEETEITIHWERPDGQGTRPAPLRVPASPRYYTFAYTGTRMPAGSYRCVVQTADGELLGRIAYELTD